MGTAWEGYASDLLGKSITVTAPEGIISGMVRGIDRDGALLVETVSQEGQARPPSRVQRILAGDVTVVDGYRKTDTVN